MIGTKIFFDYEASGSPVVMTLDDAMNFVYVFIIPGPILRHLGEFGKIRLLPGGNTRFLQDSFFNQFFFTKMTLNHY